MLQECHATWISPKSVTLNQCNIWPVADIFQTRVHFLHGDWPRAAAWCNTRCLICTYDDNIPHTNAYYFIYVFH